MAPTSKIRLVVYDMDGTRRGVVDAPLEVTWVSQQGSASTLAATWSSAVEGHRHLVAPCLVAVEIYRWSSVSWVEPKNARFVLTDVDSDRQDRTGRRKATMLSLYSHLSRACVWDTSLGADGKRTFTAVSAGAIIRSLFTEAQARGGLQGITLTNSDSLATRDANNVPWRTTITRSYDPSTQLKTVIEDLEKAGLIDVEFAGTELRILYPDTKDDHRFGIATVWIRDTYTPSTPDTTELARAANAGLLLGDSGYRRMGTAAVSPVFGRQELVFSASGVTTDADADLLLSQQFTASNVDTANNTHEWTYVNDEATPPLPGRDFSTGEWLLMDTQAGHQQHARVTAFTLALKNDAKITCSVTTGVIRPDLLTATATQQRAAASDARPIGPGTYQKMVPGSAIVPGSIPPSALGLMFDETPTAGSRNPVTSRGIKNYVDNSSGGLVSFDETPSAGSIKPVTSRGIKQALDLKQDKMTFDTTPRAGSSNPVTSNGIQQAIQAAIDSFRNPTSAQMRKMLVGSRMWHRAMSIGTVFLYSDLLSWDPSPVWKHTLYWSTMNKPILGEIFLVNEASFEIPVKGGSKLNVSPKISMGLTTTATIDPDSAISPGEVVKFRRAAQGTITASGKTFQTAGMMAYTLTQLPPGVIDKGGMFTAILSTTG